DITHSGHEVSTTIQVFEKAEAHMEDLLNRGKSVLLSVEQMTKELQQCSQDLSAKSLQTNLKIRDVFEAIRIALNAREQQLIQEANLKQSETELFLRDKTQFLEQIHKDLETCTGQLRSRLQSKSV